ncbi:ubiquitin-conjugating enzyme E2 J2-like [Oppia nitens]|uniref:ubiquitin-conjugating enzyme E2 J2-like n=1 Tax=Oppia nitens TaxID=1686743 RepID=UPI0023DC47BE|nr:ubiquitin-conjugating enzyme E2 J2-like [Oppia nitens]
MASQASTISTKRLGEDYVKLLQDPIPYVTAHPLESNILEWHYVLRGPPDSPYTGGIYHGKVNFPPDFPFKPPALRMLTPNGRFRPQASICMSMSEYHPKTWSPLWTVGAVLNGLLSFMLDTDYGVGVVQSSDQMKQELAAQSWDFNLKDKTFCKLFPDLVEEANQRKNSLYITIT